MARPTMKKKEKEEAPKKKKSTKVEREESKSKKKKVVSKGRPTGVRYVAPKDQLKKIDAAYSEIRENLDDVKEYIKKVKEKGSKSAIKDARVLLREVITGTKQLFRDLQAMKEKIKAVPADEVEDDLDEED